MARFDEDLLVARQAQLQVTPKPELAVHSLLGSMNRDGVKVRLQSQLYFDRLLLVPAIDDNPAFRAFFARP